MCYINVGQKYLDNVRDDMTELCKDELDLIVMWQLLSDINIEEMITGWGMFPKEQNKPSSTFSHHGVKVQWNNKNRFNKLFDLLDLAEIVPICSLVRKNMYFLNTIRDNYIRMEYKVRYQTWHNCYIIEIENMETKVIR